MNLADYGGIEKIKYGRIVAYLCEATKKLTNTYSADDITIKMIVHEAEVSKQTFYNHFPDKYAIFNYIFYHDIEQMIENKNIKEIMTECIPKIFADNLNYYQAIASTSAYNSFHNFFFTYLMKLNEKVIKNYFKLSEIPTNIRFATEIYSEAICNCFMSYLRKSPEAMCFTIKELGQYIYDSVPNIIYKAFDN